MPYDFFSFLFFFSSADLWTDPPNLTAENHGGGAVPCIIILFGFNFSLRPITIFHSILFLRSGDFSAFVFFVVYRGRAPSSSTVIVIYILLFSGYRIATYRNHACFADDERKVTSVEETRARFSICMMRLTRNDDGRAERILFVY